MSEKNFTQYLQLDPHLCYTRGCFRKSVPYDPIHFYETTLACFFLAATSHLYISQGALHASVMLGAWALYVCRVSVYGYHPFKALPWERQEAAHGGQHRRFLLLLLRLFELRLDLQRFRRRLLHGLRPLLLGLELAQLLLDFGAVGVEEARVEGAPLDEVQLAIRSRGRSAMD